MKKNSLENLISSLKSNEVYLSGNEPPKKSKSIALKSKGKSSKALQVIESNQETPYGDYEDGSDVKRWHLWPKDFSTWSRRRGFQIEAMDPKDQVIETRSVIRKAASTAKKYGHFTADML